MELLRNNFEKIFRKTIILKDFFYACGRGRKRWLESNSLTKMLHFPKLLLEHKLLGKSSQTLNSDFESIGLLQQEQTKTCGRAEMKVVA